MTISKKYSKISLGETLFLHKVEYTLSEETEPFTMDGLVAQQNLLRAISDNPELSNCGPAGRFEDLKLYHNGLKWVIEISKQLEEDNV